MSIFHIRPRAFLAVLAVVFLFIPMAGFAQSAAPSVSLTGFIRDAKGRPVFAEATVFAYQQNRAESAAVDKATGEYELSLAPGTWIISARIGPETGFAAPAAEAVTFGALGAVAHDIALRPMTAIISGRVLNPDGTVLSRAVINLTETDGGADVFSTEAVSGSYEVFVPAGTYAVSAFASANDSIINPRAKKLTVQDGQRAVVDLRFNLADAAITGKIYPDIIGGGALVSAVSDTGFSSQTYADADGNFAVRVDSVNAWRLSAVKRIGSLVYQSKEIIAANGGVQNISLTDISILPSSKTSMVSGADHALATLDNGMIVSFVGDAAGAAGVTVKITPLAASPQKSLSLVGPVYDIAASASDLSAIASLSQKAPFLVTLPLPIGGAVTKENQSKLKLGIWDEHARAWKLVGDSFVDLANNKIIGFIPYLARLGVTEPQPPSVPVIQPITNPAAETGGPSFLGAPFAPENLSASAAPSLTTAVLAWTDTDNETGYTLERSTSPNGSFAVIALSIAANTTVYIDTNLTAGTVYYYRLRAFNPLGGSAYSKVAVADLTPKVAGEMDTKAPVILSQAVNTATQGAAAISFTTDEPAVSSAVCAGTTVSQGNYIQTHTFTFILKPGQVACTLSVTDAAGNKVQSQLSFAVPATVPPSAPQIVQNQPQFPINRTLTVGVTGKDVEFLQKFLFERGLFDNVKPTGYFGPITKNAVIEFQKREGIAPSIGIVGPLTQAAIERAVTQ